MSNSPKVEDAKWLPDMDLNHDKQIQSLLCYRYTIGQGNHVKIGHLNGESTDFGPAMCQTGGLKPAILV